MTLVFIMFARFLLNKQSFGMDDYRADFEVRKSKIISYYVDSLKIDTAKNAKINFEKEVEKALALLASLIANPKREKENN